MSEEVIEKKSHKFLNFIILLIILVVSTVLYSMYVGTKGLVVKEYRVNSSVLTDNFSGIKIVHFSDLLYKSTIDSEDVKKIIEKINILKPDIVVFTGNLFTNGIKPDNKDISFLTKELSSIKTTLGKYAIYGEYDYDQDVYDDIMTNSGFKLLNNSYDEIYNNTNDNIYIVGLASTLKDSIDLTTSFDFYNEEDRKYIIVLVHEGAAIKYIDESDYEVDLILGGYSLNGSVVIPFLGGLFIPDGSYKYSEPYYQKGITNIYISSGIGTKNPRSRLNNKPSFNLYRLKAL
jgi:predicted MPP superfamily phosphohydrolase